MGQNYGRKVSRPNHHLTKSCYIMVTNRQAERMFQDLIFSSQCLYFHASLTDQCRQGQVFLLKLSDCCGNPSERVSLGDKAIPQSALTWERKIALQTVVESLPLAKSAQIRHEIPLRPIYISPECARESFVSLLLCQSARHRCGLALLF